MIKGLSSYINIVFFLSLATFIACDNKDELPTYLWQETQFVEVLTEVQLAESMVRLGIHRKQDSIILRDSIYNAVFRKMKVKRVDFDSNYTYYLNRPGDFEKIYDQVLINLSERSAMLREKKGEVQPKLTIEE